VQYNPTELTLQKNLSIAEIGIPGLDSPVLQFSRGQSETLTIDLFFDSTAAGTGAGAEPVTNVTDLFYQLVRIDKERHAPPVCEFLWGESGFPGSRYTTPWDSQNRTNGFKCIVESIRQRFTFFSPEGVPLRAILTVTLKEYRTLDEQIDQIDLRSADRSRAHVIQEGETMSRVADGAYEDSAAWRDIAEANGIDEPWAIVPGTIVEIPPRKAGVR
jgi:nucleoid-associated protein YgaU